MDYEAIVRNSNTIFSTMKCPYCGKPLSFYPCESGIGLMCTATSCLGVLESGFKTISNEELCSLLNNNGLNYLVQPQGKDFKP